MDPISIQFGTLRIPLAFLWFPQAFHMEPDLDPISIHMALQAFQMEPYESHKHSMGNLMDPIGIPEGAKSIPYGAVWIHQHSYGFHKRSIWGPVDPISNPY